jgi:hypothetical protein
MSSVLNSLSGEQVQEYEDRGFYRSNVEDNLGSRVDDFFQRSSGTQIIVDNEDIRKYDGDSNSVSITVDDDYAYLLESDNRDSDDGDDEPKDSAPNVTTCGD